MNQDDGELEPQEGFTGPPRSPFEMDDDEAVDFPEEVHFPGAAPAAITPRSAFRDGQPPPILPPTRPPRPGDAAARATGPVDARAPGPTPAAAEDSTGGPPENPTEKMTEDPTGGDGAGPATSALTEVPSATPEPPRPSSQDPQRQLELRAIFAVEHVMTREEILDHSARLAGVEQVELVDAETAAGLDALRRWAGRFELDPSEPIGLVQGASRIEFFQEGETVLLARSRQGFGPGVRQALILVARELARPV